MKTLREQRTDHATEYPMLALEDAHTDILGKARKGLRLDSETLAERTDLPLPVVMATLRGETADPDVLEKLAFALHLHAPSLITLAEERWRPASIGVFPGLAMFTTSFGGDMTVNAYLAWDPETREAASFDTGMDCVPMLAFIQANGLTLRKIFITHTHQDHLADLERLQRETGGLAFGPSLENPLSLRPLGHLDGLTSGRLRIRVVGTSGHTPGGLSYQVDGLSRPLVFVGDALFAGSMGGAPHAWAEALKNNRERLLILPENTVVCPGHGPLSTIGEEKNHNPFYPEMKPVQGDRRKIP